MQIDHDVAAGHATEAYRPPSRPSSGRLRLRRLASVTAAVAVALIAAQPALPGGEGAVSQALPWGGEVFTDPAVLRQWLRARGADYEQWAARHPQAAARLEGAEEPQGGGPPPDRPQSAVADEVGSDAEPSMWTSASGVMALVLFALAFSLLLLAALPGAVFARAHARVASEMRLELAAVGFAVAAGVGIVLLL